MRQQCQSSEAAHMQRHEKMRRLSAAYQQQQQILELAEQVQGLQRTNEQSALGTSSDIGSVWGYYVISPESLR